MPKDCDGIIYYFLRYECKKCGISCSQFENDFKDVKDWETLKKRVNKSCTEFGSCLHSAWIYCWDYKRLNEEHKRLIAESERKRNDLMALQDKIGKLKD